MFLDFSQTTGFLSLVGMWENRAEANELTAYRFVMHYEKMPETKVDVRKGKHHISRLTEQTSDAVIV